MNYFVEGLQGSGKSTMVQKISEFHPDYTAIREGDYSPVELAWCAYVDEDKYQEILEKYEAIRGLIEEKSFHESIHENSKWIICYTQILTDIPGFHKDLEQYEIYNNRVSLDEMKDIILSRFAAWNQDENKDKNQVINQDNYIFECSIFQNIVEDMILFKDMSDEEILDFYKKVRKALDGKEYHIVYLKADDVRGNLEVIRKERSDDQGNELWFPLMMGFFNECPYSKERGLSGEEDLIKHFIHRQELELRICKEIFEGKCTILTSKKYNDEDISGII